MTSFQERSLPTPYRLGARKHGKKVNPMISRRSLAAIVVQQKLL